MQRPPCMLSTTSGQDQDLFFVVLQGYNPGVYSSRLVTHSHNPLLLSLTLFRIDGQRACGALNSNPGIIQNTFQDEANRLFVDAYMTDRVKNWNI